MTTVNEDIDTIAADPALVTLESGSQILVQRLKTRQLMRLMKVLTRGAGEAITSLSFGEETSTEEFTGNLIGAVILSIPEAENETIDFIQSMVLPVGIIERPRTKPEIEVNEGLLTALAEELANPELDDLVTIVEHIVTTEAPHMLALGKRLAVLFKMQTKSDTAKRSASSRKSTKA